MNDRICSIEGCGSPHHARGWCRKHDQRYLRHGDPLGGGARYRTPEEAFEARTVWDGECLRWAGTIRPDGYVHIRVDGKNVYAHRYAYTRTRGPIPDGLQVDHLCGVRDCVNIDHLEAVSQQENLRRATRPTTLRRREYCGKGHKMSPENTYVWRDQRRCRTCTRATKSRAPRPAS